MAPGAVAVYNGSEKNDTISTSSCRYCGKNVRKGIKCDKCNYMIHDRCANLNINTLNDEDSWSCNVCKIIEKCNGQILSELKSKDAVINILQEEIDSLVKDKSDLLKAINCWKD